MREKKWCWRCLGHWYSPQQAAPKRPNQSTPCLSLQHGIERVCLTHPNPSKPWRPGGDLFDLSSGSLRSGSRLWVRAPGVLGAAQSAAAPQRSSRKPGRMRSKHEGSGFGVGSEEKHFKPWSQTGSFTPPKNIEDHSKHSREFLNAGTRTSFDEVMSHVLYLRVLWRVQAYILWMEKQW